MGFGVLVRMPEKGTFVINKNGSWNYRKMKGIVRIEDKKDILYY